MASTHTTPASHRGPRPPRRNGKLVVGIVIVAVLIAGGTVATIVAMRSGKADATTLAATPDPTSASPSPASTDQAAAAAAVTACRRTVAAAEAAVAAARTGAAHWSIHTQAQTDFLAHKITLSKTNAEFRRTKLLGPADQKTFAAALAAYERAPTGCDGLSASPEPDAATCATKAAALQSTVVAGRAVMKDWGSHLNTMALHAEDKMGATQARDAWIAAWKSAPANLDAFSAADSTSGRTPDCPAG